MHFPLSISEGCPWKSDGTIHTNNRYFLIPEKIDCLHNLHRENEICSEEDGDCLRAKHNSQPQCIPRRQHLIWHTSDCGGGRAVGTAQISQSSSR